MNKQKVVKCPLPIFFLTYGKKSCIHPPFRFLSSVLDRRPIHFVLCVSQVSKVINVKGKTNLAFLHLQSCTFCAICWLNLLIPLSMYHISLWFEKTQLQYLTQLLKEWTKNENGYLFIFSHYFDEPNPIPIQIKTMIASC